MDAADVLLLVFVVGLAAAAAWLMFIVSRHQNNLQNLVADINNQVVDPLLSTQYDVERVKSTTADLKETVHDATDDLGKLDKRANDMDKAGVALGKVFGLAGATAGQSLWSQATTLSTPNVDLNLISHTSALGGVTVGKKFDVSGGYFSVDSATGSVKVCGPTGIVAGSATPTALCTRFNTDATGTTVVDGPITFNGHVVATSDIKVGSAAKNNFIKSDVDGVMLQSDSMKCGIDSNQNVVVSSLGTGGASTEILKIARDGSVTVTAPSIKFSTTPQVSVGQNLWKNVQLA